MSSLPRCPELMIAPDFEIGAGKKAAAGDGIVESLGERAKL